MEINSYLTTTWDCEMNRYVTVKMMQNNYTSKKFIFKNTLELNKQ